MSSSVGRPDGADDAASRGRLTVVSFWVLIGRGMLAMTLGVGLLLYPDKTESQLLSFMGVFWLVSGLILAIRKDESLGPRASVVLGGVGIFAGLVVVGRNLIEPVLSHILVLELLGAVILVTGVCHLIGERAIGFRDRPWQTTYHSLLGLFEVAMGAILMASAVEPWTSVYWLATIWALVGGLLIFSQALALKPRPTG